MKKIYYKMYEDLRDRILAGSYPYQTYIPSENRLVEVYECSHNTLRKALAVLRSHGFRTCNATGVMFESTQSRHRPDFFTFNDTAVRGY